MNEADSIFAKESSLVQVPYVEPSFFRRLDVKSMIPMSNGTSTIYMKTVMFYMQYVMCSVQDVMCCVQYDKYDDSFYSHGITLLILIWKAHSLALS